MLIPNILGFKDILQFGRIRNWAFSVNENRNNKTTKMISKTTPIIVIKIN